MKTFISPEIKIVHIDAENILTASINTDTPFENQLAVWDDKISIMPGEFYEN
jgi:adenylate kinase family enzyme